MPRYFFHLHDGVVTQDNEGVVLADADAARARATHEALCMASESIRQSARLVLHHQVVVTDESDHEVTRVSFGEAIVVRP
jgi:hypothetical protein